jgi:hypothetical protein
MRSLKSLPVIMTVPHHEETRNMQRSASSGGYNVLATILYMGQEVDSRCESQDSDPRPVRQLRH